jgi:ketosteroid isomerase-like protein
MEISNRIQSDIETAEYEAALRSFGGELQRIEDTLEVTRILTRYGLTVDSNDVDAVAALYTDDTVIDLGMESQFEGAAGARALITDHRHQAIAGRCAHMLGPLDIRIEGDTATATGYMRVYVKNISSGTVELYRLSFTRFDLVRVGREWRIARRVARVLGDPEAPQLFRDALEEL